MDTLITASRCNERHERYLLPPPPPLSTQRACLHRSDSRHANLLSLCLASRRQTIRVHSCIAGLSRWILLVLWFCCGGLTDFFFNLSRLTLSLPPRHDWTSFVILLVGPPSRVTEPQAFRSNDFVDICWKITD